MREREGREEERETMCHGETKRGREVQGEWNMAGGSGKREGETAYRQTDRHAHNSTYIQIEGKRDREPGKEEAHGGRGGGR